MPESEDTAEFSKKRKRNDEEEEQDQVLSFQELKSYFDKKFEDINEKFSVETKYLAERIKEPAVPTFNYKGNRIQHEFNLNLIEDMEALIPVIQKGSISRATKAVKNMIAVSSNKSPAGWNTVQEYLSDDLASDSEDNKKLKAAEGRALRKQKLKVKNNSVSSFWQINTLDETPHNPQSFRPKTFRPFKHNNQANIQDQLSNYQGHVQQKHQEQQQRPGRCFECGKPGHCRNECRSYQRT